MFGWHLDAFAVEYLGVHDYHPEMIMMCESIKPIVQVYFEVDPETGVAPMSMAGDNWIFRKSMVYALALWREGRSDLAAVQLTSYCYEPRPEDWTNILDITCESNAVCEKFNKSTWGCKMYVTPGLVDVTDTVDHPSKVQLVDERLFVHVHAKLDYINYPNCVDSIKKNLKDAGIDGFDVYYHTDSEHLFPHVNVSPNLARFPIQLQSEKGTITTSYIVIDYLTELLCRLRALRNGVRYGDITLPTARFGPQPRAYIAMAMKKSTDVANLLSISYALGAILAWDTRPRS